MELRQDAAMRQRKPEVSTKGLDGTVDLVSRCRDAARKAGWDERRIENFSRNMLLSSHEDAMTAANHLFELL